MLCTKVLSKQHRNNDGCYRQKLCALYEYELILYKIPSVKCVITNPYVQKSLQYSCLINSSIWHIIVARIMFVHCLRVFCIFFSFCWLVLGKKKEKELSAMLYTKVPSQIPLHFAATTWQHLLKDGAILSVTFLSPHPYS